MSEVRLHLRDASLLWRRLERPQRLRCSKQPLLHPCLRPSPEWRSRALSCLEHAPRELGAGPAAPGGRGPSKQEPRDTPHEPNDIRLMPVAVAPNEVRSPCAFERTGGNAPKRASPAWAVCIFTLTPGAQRHKPWTGTAAWRPPAVPHRKTFTGSARYGTSRAVVPLCVPLVS